MKSEHVNILEMSKTREDREIEKREKTQEVQSHLHRLKEVCALIPIFDEREPTIASDLTPMLIGVQRSAERVASCDLLALPIESLTLLWSAVEPLYNQINTLQELMSEISKRESSKQVIAPETQQQFDRIIRKIAKSADSFFLAAAPYTFVIGREHLDAEERINVAIAHAMKAADPIVEEITQRKKEADEALKAIRVVSAEMPTERFEQIFSVEYGHQKWRSILWLITAIIFGALTISVAVFYLYENSLPDFLPKTSTDAPLAIIILSRVTIFGILFGATLWSAKTYRALLNLSEITKHRAQSIATFQAFVSATENVQIKDAVLLEATRTIFSHQPSGLVSDSNTATGDIAAIGRLARLFGNR